MSSRTRWWSWMAERRPEMDWPRQRAAATAAAPTTGLLRWFSPQRRCAGRRGGRDGGSGSRGWSRGGSEARERRQRRARPASHGGRMSCRGAERGERARERAGSGEGDGELGRGSGYPHRAQGHAAWRWGRSARMAATPWPRVGILTSRWRARSSASWKPFLGWFGWEFDGGPLTKFDLHPMLYKFR